MGRLIDADHVKDFFFSETSGTEDVIRDLMNTHGLDYANDINEEVIMAFAKDLLKAVQNVIDTEPTAYDPDKVVEQLEKKIQTHARCIEYEKKNGTITEEFQQRKAVKEFGIWCQCNNPYGVACTSVRNIKCNRPIHHDYGVISLPNGQCV